MNFNSIICGDSLEVLKTLPSESVDCCITSPPYWGLRDYGVDGQLGLEKTPEEYVAKMVAVFSEVKRVLKKEGTFWLNLGDSYNSTPIGRQVDPKRLAKSGEYSYDFKKPFWDVLPAKNLIGIPWRVAFALQADGWYLRQDIIWHKPNPMPESVTDRCTKSHEYVFLLTKSPKYYFDNEAIKEKAVIEEQRPAGVVRDRMFDYDSKEKAMGKRVSGGPIGGVQKARAFGSKEQLGTLRQDVGNVFIDNGYRNKRSVWTVNTMPYSEAHFATFPEKLIEPMVLAGCPKEVCMKCGKGRERIIEKPEMPKIEGSDIDRFGNGSSGTHRKVGQAYQNWRNENPDKTVGFTDCGCGLGFTKGIILDIFMGAGTTAIVAKKNGRNFLGIELNEKYIEIAERRIAGTTSPMF